MLEVYWESIMENITAKEIVLRFKVWAMSEVALGDFHFRHADAYCILPQPHVALPFCLLTAISCH